VTSNRCKRRVGNGPTDAILAREAIQAKLPTCSIERSKLLENDLSVLILQKNFRSFLLIWQKEQVVLVKEIDAAKAKVSIGAKHRHYKVLGLGFLEATEELCAIYQADYGKRLTFLRSLDIWLEQVE